MAPLSQPNLSQGQRHLSACGQGRPARHTAGPALPVPAMLAPVPSADAALPRICSVTASNSLLCRLFRGFRSTPPSPGHNFMFRFRSERIDDNPGPLRCSSNV